MTVYVKHLIHSFLVNYHFSKQSDGKASSTVMSLNQTLRSNYQNSTSKRQRPVDEAVPLKGNEATAPSSSSTKVAGTVIKKKKSTFASNSSTSSSAKESIYNHVNSNVMPLTRPNTRLKDLAGLDTMINQIKESMFFPVLYPELYHQLGVKPATGLLLQGPSGCGKSALTYAIAGELNLPFFKVSGPELIGGASGESEERIRQVFEAARMNAPSILFIDALDVIAAKRDSTQRGMDRRIVAQLCDSIDEITALSNNDNDENERDDDELTQAVHSEMHLNESSSPEENFQGLNGQTPSSSSFLLTSSKSKKTGNKYVLLIAATNK